jgi:acid phosphatase type 7
MSTTVASSTTSFRRQSRTILSTGATPTSPSSTATSAFREEQTHWLEEDLKAHQSADYHFVSAHHPLLEKYNVTARFFGHDHNNQHYLKDGNHYIVPGGGGAPLYDVDKPPADITVKVASVENFVAVSVEGKTAHVQVIWIDGKVLDEFDLHTTSQPGK